MNDFIFEGSIATYSLRVNGPIKGLYTGTFKFKCFLTPLELIAADREFRDLIGKVQENVGRDAHWYAFALTELKHRIVSAPPFWTDGNPVFPGGDVADKVVLEVLLKAALDAEKEYLRRLVAQHEEAIGTMKEAVEKQKAEIQAELENEEVIKALEAQPEVPQTKGKKKNAGKST